jgi:hypothetical protein
MLIRSAMSGLRVLAGLRASVETFPMWWAFPTSAYDARYDSPTAYGGLSLSQDSSTCLARGLPPCVGASIVPCPGFPFRASEAGDHTLACATAETSGASQVLRRLSSCMPRPEDSGGPAPPCHVGWARVAFGSVQTLGVRYKRLFEAVPALQGRRSPLRPTGCSVYASSSLFTALTAPPWTQDSLRVGGEPLPDEDFHLARDAKLVLAR